MWVGIVLVAVVVLGLAAYAGLGHLGEMPGEAVIDRPKGVVPEGPVNEDFVLRMALPRATTGYDPTMVDDHLVGISLGLAEPSEEIKFELVRNGYDMQVIDEILLRQRPSLAPSVVADGSAEVLEEASFSDEIAGQGARILPDRE